MTRPISASPAALSRQWDSDSVTTTRSNMKETAVATDFTGKTALITSAGHGIGRAVTLGLAEAGADLILLARSTGQLAEAETMLLALGAPAEQIRILPADLGDEEERTRAAAAALAPGRVDILINNTATVEPLVATVTVPAAELRRRSRSTLSRPPG